MSNAATCDCAHESIANNASVRVTPCNQVMRTGEGVSQGLGATGVVDAEAAADVDDSGVET